MRLDSGGEDAPGRTGISLTARVEMDVREPA